MLRYALTSRVSPSNQKLGAFRDFRRRAPDHLLERGPVERLGHVSGIRVNSANNFRDVHAGRGEILAHRFKPSRLTFKEFRNGADVERAINPVLKLREVRGGQNP